MNSIEALSPRQANGPAAITNVTPSHARYGRAPGQPKVRNIPCGCRMARELPRRTDARRESALVANRRRTASSTAFRHRHGGNRRRRSYAGGPGMPSRSAGAPAWESAARRFFPALVAGARSAYHRNPHENGQRLCGATAAAYNGRIAGGQSPRYRGNRSDNQLLYPPPTPHRSNPVAIFDRARSRSRQTMANARLRSLRHRSPCDHIVRAPPPNASRLGRCHLRVFLLRSTQPFAVFNLDSTHRSTVAAITALKSVLSSSGFTRKAADCNRRQICNAGLIAIALIFL